MRVAPKCALPKIGNGAGGPKRAPRIAKRHGPVSSRARVGREPETPQARHARTVQACLLIPPPHARQPSAAMDRWLKPRAQSSRWQRHRHGALFLSRSLMTVAGRLKLESALNRMNAKVTQLFRAPLLAWLAAVSRVQDYLKQPPLCLAFVFSFGSKRYNGKEHEPKLRKRLERKGRERGPTPTPSMMAMRGT
jgi:hypothetical protein